MWYIVCDRVFQSNENTTNHLVVIFYSGYIEPCLIWHENWLSSIHWNLNSVWFTPKTMTLNYQTWNARRSIHNIHCQSWALIHSFTRHQWLRMHCNVPQVVRACLKRGSNIVQIHGINFNMYLFPIKGETKGTFSFANNPELFNGLE